MFFGTMFRVPVFCFCLFIEMHSFLGHLVSHLHRNSVQENHSRSRFGHESLRNAREHPVPPLCRRSVQGYWPTNRPSLAQGAEKRYSGHRLSEKGQWDGTYYYSLHLILSRLYHFSQDRCRSARSCREFAKCHKRISRVQC
jgi:hypothetical protein